MKKFRYRIVFDWLDRDTYGLCDPNTRTVTLNLPLYVAGIYLHERFHERYPKATERRVKQLEERAIKRMSVKKIKRLARIVLARGKWLS